MPSIKFSFPDCCSVKHACFVLIAGDINQEPPFGLRQNFKQLEHDDSTTELIKTNTSNADEQCTNGRNVPFYPEGYYRPSSGVICDARRRPASDDVSPSADERHRQHVAQWKVGHGDSFPAYTSLLPAFPVDLSLPSPPLPVLPNAYYSPVGPQPGELSCPNHAHRCIATGESHNQIKSTEDNGRETKKCVYPRRPAPRRYVMDMRSPPFSSYSYARNLCKVLLPFGSMSSPIIAHHDTEKGQRNLKSTAISARFPPGKIKCTFDSSSSWQMIC